MPAPLRSLGARGSSPSRVIIGTSSRTRRIAPFGSWASPIAADLAATASISFTDLALDGRDLYWLETRPEEGGRGVIMRRSPSGTVSELTPLDFNVRSTVHEYGGGAFTAHRGCIFFVNLRDQRVYQQTADLPPVPLTPGGRFRHADLALDAARHRIVCVREDHSAPGEPVNSIVAIDTDGRGSSTLASGHDFFAAPRLSPDGGHIAYLAWDHPNMPWDACELYVARLHSDGSLDSAHRVAGNGGESVFQPTWSPGGVLHFVSDRTGWWNLCRWRAGILEALHPMPAEFGRAMWNFGSSTFGFVSETRILCCYTANGMDRLAWLDTSDLQFTPINCPYITVDLIKCAKGFAAFIGGLPCEAPSIVQLDLQSGVPEPVRSSFRLQFDPVCISPPQPVEWRTREHLPVHGLYYEPVNQYWVGPAADRPPLLLLCHGGPTSAAVPALQLALQYWTSRGFAVLDANYGGSTGYGREYRRRLNGEWGIVDVADCCAGALALASAGLVDRAHLTVRGGSAGGFTALSCLTSRSEVFSAGSCRYAIADLEMLARETHKFESRYLETLIAPFPERRDLYMARSPIRHVDALRSALILFQGDEDRIVSPSQSRLMFDAAGRAGLASALLVFPGEGHGFRKAATLAKVLQSELYFLSRVYGFAPAEPLPAVEIQNVPHDRSSKHQS